MRIVHLRDIRTENDIYGKVQGLEYGNRQYELVNRRQDSVYFINPQLLRGVFGVKIIDKECSRQDRSFGSNYSRALRRGELPV